MMRPPNDLPMVYLCRDAIDFRKGVDELVTLTSQQLNWLLDGYDITRMKPHEKLVFSSVL